MEVLLASNLFILTLFLSAGFWYARCVREGVCSQRTWSDIILSVIQAAIFFSLLPLSEPRLFLSPPFGFCSGTLTILVGFRYLLGTIDVWPFPEEAQLQVHSA